MIRPYCTGAPGDCALLPACGLRLPDRNQSRHSNNDPGRPAHPRVYRAHHDSQMANPMAVEHASLTATAAIGAAAESTRAAIELMSKDCKAGEVELVELEAAVKKLRAHEKDGSYWFESFGSFFRMLKGALTLTSSKKTRASMLKDARTKLGELEAELKRMLHTAAETSAKVPSLHNAVEDAAKRAAECLERATEAAEKADKMIQGAE